MGGALVGINFAVAVAGMVICSLGLALALLTRPVQPKTRRYLVAIFATLVVYTACDLFGQVGDDFHGQAWALADRIALFFESALSTCALLILTVLLLYTCGRDWRRNIAFDVVGALWLVYIVLLVQTQFTGNLYSVGDDNVYRRGPYYPILLIPVLLIMVTDMIVLWRDRRRLSAKQRAAFAIYLAVPAASMAWQMVSYGLLATVLGTSLGALGMFCFVASDQADSFRQKEAEVVRLRTDVMLSQIQPHFLFNTLDTIYGLVDEDPQVAKKAIASFSQYLRANLDSLKHAAPVPVERELVHVRTYLELEHMSDASRVNYEIDAQTTDFLVPALSVQTLTENAVKHGLGGRESGGKVTVRTYERDNEFVVVVEDDGIGFDPNELDEAAGIGISNTRERVSAMCGGSLEITSEPGRGATAVMRIPKPSSRKPQPWEARA
ncbi:MAG: histidine kinase [Coriobacteriales bacterium]|nr:histidine kinase [Coriobacteriales bacterium]